MSKYTTKQLMNMCQDTIDAICNVKCDSKKCLFKKSLRKYRIDGYCLKDIPEVVKRFIIEVEEDIKTHQEKIKELKEEKRFYQNAIKAFEKEMEK